MKERKPKIYGNIRKIRRCRSIVFNIIFYTIFTIIFIAFLIALIVTTTMITTGDNVGAFFGYSVKVVATGSMTPTIMPEDVVIIHHSDDYVYKTGDIITFTSLDPEVGTYTHRIVANVEVSGQNAYLTKGDANNAPDKEYAFYEGIIGKVVFVIPNAGKIVYFMQRIPKPLIFGVLISLVVIFTLIQVIDIIKYQRSELTEEEARDEKRVNLLNAIYNFKAMVKKALAMKF